MALAIKQTGAPRSYARGAVVVRGELLGFSPGEEVEEDFDELSGGHSTLHASRCDFLVELFQLRAQRSFISRAVGTLPGPGGFIREQEEVVPIERYGQEHRMQVLPVSAVEIRSPVADDDLDAEVLSDHGV